MFYNNLGWALLKLVEWGETQVPQGIAIDTGNKVFDTALLSEKFLHRSISLNTQNKLSHANLCLLYSTPAFREVDRKRYLTRCRYYGKKALLLDPKYINGNRDLAIALVRYGELDEAYSYYSGALQLSSDPDKKDEVIKDVVDELYRLKNLDELVALSQYKLDNWKMPNGVSPQSK